MTAMHALFKTKVECKMTWKRRIIFFARFWFESDDQGILNSPPAVTEQHVIADACRESLAQLHIYRAAAQTRTVCGARFRPKGREIIA